MSEPPDPVLASDVADFRMALRLLRVWAGSPSLATLRRSSGIPRTTIHDHLHPGRSTLPPLDFVRRYVSACGCATEAVEAWEAAWRRLKGHESSATGPSEPTSVAVPQTHSVPRQLPVDITTFGGRSDELAQLDQLLQAQPTGGSGPVVVIHGAPGSGKSALAVRAGKLASAHYPDGQLYVNLRGATPAVAPLEPADALRALLRSLGVDPREIPNDVDGSSSLFRTMVAGRRMLLLLDNAASVVQVRPLVPGDTGCAVLITSRTTLATLEGATHMSVGPLTPAAAATMIEALIADDRAAADPPAMRRLGELCDRLPLALHVVAARLKTRPNWTLSRMVVRLTDERHRLAELAAGDLAVRSTLAVSYTALRDSNDHDDQQAARVLGMLGAVRVHDVDVDLAAALFGTTTPAIDRIMERLLDAHLIEEATPGRYHMHDLIRLFAAEIADEDLTADETAVVLKRALGHYLSTVSHANGWAYPHRVHYPVPAAEASPKQLKDRREALSWLEDERANIVALTGQALPGPPQQARLAVGLTLAMHWFFTHGSYISDQIPLTEESIAVAARLGDRRAEADASPGTRRSATTSSSQP